MKYKNILIILIIFLLTAVMLGQGSAATLTYTYDSLNRVTSVDYGDGNTEEFTYDAAGNRLTLVVTSNNISPTADPHGPYSGVEGQAIMLDGSISSDSDGSIELYEWDIDNDGTYDYSSPLPTQSQTYVQQGTYTIKLRVTDNLGATDETTTTATISDISPVASFTTDPLSGVEPLTVNSDASGSSGYDVPLSYAWDFGDSNTDSGVTVSHTFSQDGSYTVTLTVTDSDGSTDTASIVIVASDSSPTAGFTGSPTSGAAPFTVTFTDSSTGYDQPLSYGWDFDNDGVIDSTVQNPTYIYDTAGIYTVSLTVTDADGSSDTLTKENYIRVNEPPVANAGPDQNVFTGEIVTLDGSGSYDPEGETITFLWTVIGIPPGSSITDASLSDVTGAKPIFTPDVDGTYVLELTVSDGELQDSDTVSIFATTANVAPNADAGPDQNVLTGSLVSLDGSASNDTDNGPQPLSFLWSFDELPQASGLTDNDITNKEQVNAGFTPEVDGTYVVRVVVSDGELTSEDTMQIMAITENVPPNADAGDDITIFFGVTAVLDGSASNDSDNGPQPLSYLWSFVTVPTESSITNGDLSGGDTVSPSFIPDVIGTYVLELMVTDGQDSDFDNVAVTVEYVIGDVDGNGDINIVDALLVARYSAGLSVSNFIPDAADVNCDESIDIVDALLIARKAAGLPVISWCE